MFVNYQRSTDLNMQFKQYFLLTKPKIVVLLALTGVVAMRIANPLVQPSMLQILIFIMCGYGTAGGAMAINNAIDKDIDEKMDRTRNRASIDNLSSRQVTFFGTSLIAIGLLGSWITFGPFTTFFLAWGASYYIFGYTLVLKRNTWLNTILGGLASPAPVWAAFAAIAEISGDLPAQGWLTVSPIGWWLGLLIFIWTPSHTWAMAVKNYDDYVRAEVPMLPVIVGIRKTAWINLIATLVVIASSLWIGKLILPNLWVTIFLGALFLASSIHFALRPSVQSGKFNFHAHNIWLALYFLLL